MTLVDKKDKKFLAAMIAAIFISRLILSVFVMQARGGELSQDEGLYSKKALLLSFQMRGYKDIEKHFADYFIGDNDMLQKNYGFNVYTRLLAGFYYVFGYQIQTARMINAVIFIAAFIFIFYTAKSLFGRKTAEMASVIFSFFPSIMLWSSMICVDITIIACEAAFIFFAMKFLKANRTAVLYLCLMLFSIILIRSIRPYIAFLMAIFTVLGIVFRMFAMAGRRSKIVIISIAAAAVVLAVLNSGSMDFIKGKLDRASYEMIKNQMGFAVVDDSSYVIFPSHCYASYKCGLHDIAAAYVRGMGYAIFAPFPWRIESGLQLLSLPQVLVWYMMIPFILYGIYLGFRDNRAAAIFVFLFCFAALSVLALASGNVGAVFRHRDMVTPFLIIFFAAGIMKIGEAK